MHSTGIVLYGDKIEKIRNKELYFYKISGPVVRIRRVKFPQKQLIVF